MDTSNHFPEFPKESPETADRPLHGLFPISQSDQSDGLEEYGDDYRVFEKPTASQIADLHYRRQQAADQKLSGEQSTRTPVRGPVETIDAAIDPAADNETTVELVSRGHTLIVGHESARMLQCAEQLGPAQSCFLLVDGLRPADAAGRSELRWRTDVRIEGCMGRFKVSGRPQGKHAPLERLSAGGASHFDLVLDLRPAAAFDSDLKPAGYYATDGDDRELERILREIPEMTGIFEKACLICYRSDACAHIGAARTGCRRCLDVCPAGALQSADKQIRIDHGVCLGCGLCATVCPTGALRCRHTPADELLSAVYGRLTEERTKAGPAPTVAFHSPQSPAVDSLDLPRLDFAVSQIGGIGPEVWLGALAYGAGRVILMLPDAYPASLRQALAGQIEWTAALLAGIGLAADRIQLVLSDGLSDTKPLAAVAAPAEFAPFQSKRALILRSIDHLAAGRPGLPAGVALPSQAPFGGLSIDQEACSLCLACAGACPTAALSAVGQRPGLHMLESECIQCGRCRRICPENALRLNPRMIIEPQRRDLPQKLYSEEPLACVCCGKPFASAKMVEKLAARLGGHWMYSNANEIRRLKMCRNCRIQDFFLHPNRDSTL